MFAIAHLIAHCSFSPLICGSSSKSYIHRPCSGIECGKHTNCNMSTIWLLDAQVLLLLRVIIQSQSMQMCID